MAEVSSMCKYCVNRKGCYTPEGQVHNLACSGKFGQDMFVPNDDVKQYFEYGYVGVCGMNGHIYHFDTTNEKLVSTHSIQIGHKKYCPYCGDRMYSIQDKVTLAVIGHCCICEGARAELEYEKELKQLKKELEDERIERMSKLHKKYEKSLAFNTDKLIEIKQEVEEEIMRRNLSRINHFSTTNGEPYTNIDQFS